MKRILDSSFRYQPSYATDLRKTFARVRQQQRATDAEEPKEPRKVKVVVLDQLKRVGER